MRPFLIAMALAWATTVQAQPRQASDRICVPAALLDRLVANVATEPWSTAAATMDAVREFSRAPVVPCLPPPEKDKP